MNLRKTILALCLAGSANALLMLSYHLRIIDRLPCPFFGDGCAAVARSPRARHLGVPNAAAGIVAYAGMAALVLPAPAPPGRAKALAGIAIASFVASIALLYEQATVVRRWCFWCIAAAVINGAIVVAALRLPLRDR